MNIIKLSYEKAIYRYSAELSRYMRCKVIIRSTSHLAATFYDVAHMSSLDHQYVKRLEQEIGSCLRHSGPALEREEIRAVAKTLFQAACNLTISFHGKEDEVIPITDAKKIMRQSYALIEESELLSLPMARLNKWLNEFLRGCEHPAFLEEFQVQWKERIKSTMEKRKKSA